MNYETKIEEAKTSLELAFECALEEFEAHFLSEQVSDKLMNSVREGIESLNIRFRDLVDAAVYKKESKLVRDITNTINRCTRPTLTAHLKSCNKAYVDSLVVKASEVMKDVIIPSGHNYNDNSSVQTIVTEAGKGAIGDLMGVVVGLIAAVVAAQVAVTTQTVLIAFTTTVINPAGIIVAVVAGVVAVFFGKKLLNPAARLKKKLSEELVPLFSNRPPTDWQQPGILHKLWKDEIYPARKDDFQRIWTGSEPDGSAVYDDYGKPFDGLEGILRRNLEKRRKRAIPVNLPKSISDHFGKKDALLKREIARYWRKLPQVPEDAFVVAVVGPTSAGKSTLLNLLLGNQFIEERISEHTTPCPILLRQSEKAELKAFKEGRKSPDIQFFPDKFEAVPESFGEDMLGWIEKTALNRGGLNPKDREVFWGKLPSIKPLQRIEVGYPVGWLPGNCMLADLPGVEGHYQDDTYEKAYELTELSRVWMARADVVIFVLRHEQVRLANCYRFIQEFEQKERPMAVLISRMDELDLLELGVETPEAGRDLVLKEVLSFFHENGIEAVDEENVFLGASRLKSDSWEFDQQGRHIQQLALGDLARLGLWLAQKLENCEHEGNRLERQYQADQEIRQYVYQQFTGHIAPLVAKALDGIGWSTPDDFNEIISGENAFEWVEWALTDRKNEQSLAPTRKRVKRLYEIRDQIIEEALCMLRIPKL